MEGVESESMLLLLYFFVFGTIVGSFINAVEYRLYRREPIAKKRGGRFARSQCPHCGRQLKALELVPILSYAVLLGRCRTCHAPISPQYPLVEAATGVLFVLSFWLFGFSLAAVAASLFCAVLVFLFVYDVKYQLVPDVVTVPAIVVALPLQWWIFDYSFQSLLIGAAVGGGFFALQYVVSRGRWVGGGDIRMGVLMGVLLGMTGILVALFLAYVVGAVVALGLLATKRLTLQSKMPFGPFLAAATVVTFLYGSELVDWYLSLFI